jgi:hypothetical protein
MGFVRLSTWIVATALCASRPAMAEQSGVVCGSADAPEKGNLHLYIEMTGEKGRAGIEEGGPNGKSSIVAGSAEVIHIPGLETQEVIRITWSAFNGGIFLVNRTTGEFASVDIRTNHATTEGKCVKGGFKQIPADALDGRKF